MYIESGREDEIPKGAIRLTRDEVYEYMTDLITKWPGSVELWALKYGNPILASGVVLSSTFTLSYYRKKLKLGNYGQLTLFLPIVLIPSLMNQVYHNTKTTKRVILQDDCPVCIFTQSAAIQLGTGVFYPLLGSVAGTYLFAHKMGTFRLDYSGKSDIVTKFGEHLVKASRPLFNRLTVFVIGNLLLSYVVTNYQMENLEFLRLKMLEEHKAEKLYQSKAIKNKSPSS